MLVLLAIAAAAADVTLTDVAPDTAANPVLVVATPGVELPSYQPLLTTLRERGHDAHLLEFGCGALDTERLAREVQVARDTLGPATPVLAHGFGATLALASHRAGDGDYVLLAPVLKLPALALTEHLAGLEVGASVLLSQPHEWNGHDAAKLLVGELELGCVPAPFAAEVQGWVGSSVPLSLPEVDSDVFIVVSAGDQLAPVEATVPASRALPRRELVRLGLGRLDHQDFDHGELLTHPTPVRVAARALERLR